MALIKAESLEMGKPGGIEMYIINKKNRNVYICDMGLELWEFSRIMLILVAGTTIWLDVPFTEMRNTREKEYLSVSEGGRDFSFGRLKLNIQVSYTIKDLK